MSYLGITVPRSVEDKVWSWVARDGVRGRRDINAYLWRSEVLDVGQETIQGVCWVLGIKDPESLWLRSCSISNTTTAVFIGSGDHVVEVVSRRGVKQMVKAWLHECARVAPLKDSSGRLNTIFKYKVTRSIQGGLIKQERRPIDRWAKARQERRDAAWRARGGNAR